MSAQANTEALPKKEPDIETKEGRVEIMNRGAKGDKSILPLLTKLFDRDKGRGGSLVEMYGNIYKLALQATVRYTAGNDLTLQEAMRRKIEAVRDEVAGFNPTPLERILSERVALTWYDANEMDCRFLDSGGVSFKDAAYREDRRDRANRRFLAACRALATVRKLSQPSI
jgi:hypothetical protein